MSGTHWTGRDSAGTERTAIAGRIGGGADDRIPFPGRAGGGVRGGRGHLPPLHGLLDRQEPGQRPPPPRGAVLDLQHQEGPRGGLSLLEQAADRADRGRSEGGGGPPHGQFQRGQDRPHPVVCPGRQGFGGVWGRRASHFTKGGNGSPQTVHTISPNGEMY